MKINCIIIDDEPLAAEVIATHLSEFSNMELIGTFTNPICWHWKLLKVEMLMLFL